MKKALRRVAEGLAWIALVLASLALSLAYHIQLGEVRAQLAQLLETLASDALRGDLRIGSLDAVSLGEVRARDVQILDAEGRVVISAPTVVAVPDLGALLHDGTIHIGHGHIEDAELTLYVVGDEGLEMSFIRAFEPAHPGPPGGEPVHLVIDDLELVRTHAHGDVPRYPGLDVEDLDTTIRIEVSHDVTVDAYHGHGRMVGPYPGVTDIDNVVVHFSTDWLDGLTGYLRVHRDEARATADVRVDRPPGWGEEGTPHVSIWAHADPMCVHTLRAMGFPGLDLLESCARGWGHLEGPADDLALDASLTTDAGDVVVHGRIPAGERMSFSLETPSLALERLVPSAPALTFAGEGTVTLLDDPEDDTLALVTLAGDSFTVDGWAVPGFRARAAVTRDALLVERIHAPYLDGHVDVSGRVGFDGTLDLHADVDVADVAGDPNVARLVPGAHGGLRGGIDITSGPGGTALTVDGNVEARGVRYGPVRAGTLRGRVWARGGEPLPELSVALTGDGVTVSGLRFGHATITGHGGGRRPLQLHVTSSGGADVRSSAVDATVTRERDGTLVVTLDRTQADVGLGSYHIAEGSHPSIRIRGGRIEIDPLDIRGQGESGVGFAGTLVPNGESDLTFSLRDFDLTTVVPLLPPQLATLTGLLDADGTLRGRLADPELHAAGNVHRASFEGREIEIEHYDLGYVDGHSRILVDGNLGSRGGIHVEGGIAAPFAVLTDGTRFLSEARFENLELDLDRANVAFLLPFFGPSAIEMGLGGRLTVAAVLSGPPIDLDVPRAVVIVDQFGPEGWTPIRGKVELRYVADALRVDRLWIADPLGELILAEAGTVISIVDPPADLQGWLTRLSQAPWYVAARVEPRRLDAWPRPLGKILPRGIVVGGSMTLSGDARGTSGSLEAVLRWDEPAASEVCAADLRPALQVHALTDFETTHVEADGFVASEHVMHATADVPTRIHAWLENAYAELEPTRVDVSLRALRLETLPWTCAYAVGTVTARDLHVTLGTDQPDLGGTIEVAHMTVRDPEDGVLRGQEMHAAVSIESVGRGATELGVRMLLSDESGEQTEIAQFPSFEALRSDPSALEAEDGEVALALALPLRFAGRLSVPEVDWTSPLFFWGDFQEVHLAPLLAYIPGFLDADLVANGRVRVEGPFDTAVIAGGLDLRDGHLRISSVGQHLHGIEGVLRFEPGRIVLPEDRPLRARDGDGIVDVTGGLDFEGLRPVHADLRLRPSDFPVRREGATLATLSGLAIATADIASEGVDLRVRTEELAIGLPPSLAGSVQSLDRRRDVLLVAGDAPELADIGRSRFPYHIHVEAPGFTVARNDFEADVRADLEVTYDDPDLSIGGVAEISHGTFEILGKRFTVQHGAIVFDGRAEIDPDISVVAVYALPGRRGATITVTVSGRLSNLDVGFSSTESSDTGEILALLVSGRTSRPQDAQSAQQAGDQAANFVAGLTAGILTLGLQQQFGGDFVPNVAIETGGLGSVGVRVGFNADWIIPDFMREVVLDAYVEGFVGSVSAQQQQQQTGSSSGAGGVGGGASIELQLPFNGVLSGTVVPPSSWGADLSWEP